MPKNCFIVPTVIEHLTQLIQLNVHLYHHARVCGDWRIAAHETGRSCFHIATEGGVAMNVPGHGEWQLHCGDLVIFPREIPHHMHSLTPLKGEQQHLAIGPNAHIAGTNLLCGEVTFRHRANTALLEALPPVFVIEKTDQTPWLCQILLLLQQESQHSQARILHEEGPQSPILNRLCELLFVYALRHFVQQRHPKSGLLALYGDEQMARALLVMHQAPEKPWQVQTLADAALMSRTQFARRFRQLCDWTPMQYLTWWRMQLAWSALSRGDRVAQVALAVGYQSEAAFSRAFSQAFGVSAGAVRRAEGEV